MYEQSQVNSPLYNLSDSSSTHTTSGFSSPPSFYVNVLPSEKLSFLSSLIHVFLTWFKIFCLPPQLRSPTESPQHTYIICTFKICNNLILCFFGSPILVHLYSVDNQYYWKFLDVRDHIFYFYWISLGYLS